MCKTRKTKGAKLVLLDVLKRKLDVILRQELLIFMLVLHETEILPHIVFFFLDISSQSTDYAKKHNTVQKS